MSNITVNFVKKDDNNIYLESLIDDGKEINYIDDNPLLTIDEDGTYSKVSDVNLSEILKNNYENPSVNENINNIDIHDDDNEISQNPFEDGRTEKLLKQAEEEARKADEENKRKQEELDQAFKQAEEEDEKKRKQEELDQAFKQAEEEDEKKRKQA